MRQAALAAVLVVAACKPAVHGRCSKPGECRAGSFCSTEGVCLPGAGLSLAVFEPPASDAVNGWVPRSGPDLDVRATVQTQDGSPPEEATLALQTCPAQAPCSYSGTLVSPGSSSAEFSFQVPRAAQATGSEAPVAFTVTAKDQAGNQAQATGALQIDDAPPAIGTFAAVSRGVTGEDGNTWFLGGSGANPVEIAVPVADSGAGFAALSLQLDSSDVIAGTTLSVPGTPGGDGTVHFQLPASAVRGKEQRVRFTLTALDKLQHAASIGPDGPRTQIWVDAAAPTVSAPQVDYAGASGPGPQCAAESPTYLCGRQAGTHLLPDDTATVSFDAYDCGAGLLAAQPDGSASTAASTHGFAVTETGQGASACTNGSSNPLHHYAFTLDLKTLALDPPTQIDGTAKVQLAANALDRVQQPSNSSGSAVVSVWRWKSQVATNAQPSGSAALLPGPAGSRQIAVGTTLSGLGANLFVLNPDGSQAWFANVGAGIGADVATGQSGVVYAISPAVSCGTSCSGALNIVPAPASGTQATPQPCPAANVSFGAPAAILSSPESAIAASTAHSGLTTPNVYFFSSASGSCVVKNTTVNTGDYAGVSASQPTIFFANAQGFLSEDLSGSTSFNTSSLRIYNAGTTSLPTLAPPSIAAESPMSAIFGTAASDQSVRRTVQANCNGSIPCWQTDSGYTPFKANSGLPYTPVFDQSNIYVADDHGAVYAFDRKAGGAKWTADFRGAMPAGWPPAASAIISAPVLLSDGSVLEVRSDGVVALASAAGIVPLLQAKPVSTPVSPVIDLRGPGGIAYVSDGTGWLWAVQLAAAPAPPGPSVWPRPGRDSCNSRNAASACP